VTDLIQRRFAFVHVEIHDHNELADVLKKRVPAIVLPKSPAQIATVAEYKHYSVVLRVRSRPDATQHTVKGVRHLMIVGMGVWAAVVKAIALHDPQNDFLVRAGGAADRPPPKSLSYGIQLLKSCGDASLEEHRHLELCQPIFDYWWQDFQKVWIMSAFNPTLGKTLSSRLSKYRWESISDFWLEVEELFVHGETKHKLGHIEEAYQYWREAVDLHHLLAATDNWPHLRNSVDSCDRNRISDMMRTINSNCTSLCLAFLRTTQIRSPRNSTMQSRHLGTVQARTPGSSRRTPKTSQMLNVASTRTC